MPTFNHEIVYDIIAEYKRTFHTHRPKELYKWEAIKHFQDNWDINASNFPDMLKEAFRKHGNLFGTRVPYPYLGLRSLVDAYPKQAREMFIHLYNEVDNSLVEKVQKFIRSAKDLSRESGGLIRHRQNEKSVSLYMFLHEPDKHYMYNLADKLTKFATKTNYAGLTVGTSLDKLQSYYAVCDELLSIVLQDNELIKMSSNSLLPIETYYQDSNYHLLTDDILYFVRCYLKDNLWKSPVYPDELTPDTSEHWEGKQKTVAVNVHERNQKARRECIKHYKPKCYICDFDFGKEYGEAFSGMIHVHHLNQISETDEEYVVHPINDLRPVCPNCHMVLHSKKECYSIDEVKSFLKEKE